MSASNDCRTKSIKATQAGFTLVEIAIVLVIIGLLLGGILKGQEMITQAKIKNVINDFNGLSAAMYSYQDRYRSLPGDDLNATGRWKAADGTTDITSNGDGNGIFNCTASQKGYNDPALATQTGQTGKECNIFWQHLRLAGFVPGATTGTSSTQQPANAVNGIVGIQTGGMGFSSNIICTSNLPDKVAIAVDSQMDDGASTTGQVRGMFQTSPNQDVGATGSAYAETGVNQYLLCKNL